MSPVRHNLVHGTTTHHSTRISQQSIERQRQLEALHATRTTLANTLRAKAAAADDLTRSMGQARLEEGAIAAQALQHALQQRGMEEAVQEWRDALRRACWERDRLVQRLARVQRALGLVQVRGVLLGGLGVLCTWCMPGCGVVRVAYMDVIDALSSFFLFLFVVGSDTHGSMTPCVCPGVDAAPAA